MGTLRETLRCESGCGAPAQHLPAPPAFPLGLNAGSSQTRAPAVADEDTGISQRSDLGSLSLVSGLGGDWFPREARRPQLFCISKGAAWRAPARGWGAVAEGGGNLCSRADRGGKISGEAGPRTGVRGP